MTTRRKILAALLAATLGLSACTYPAPTEPSAPVAEPAADSIERPPTTFENYVALGDSYASMGTRDDLQSDSPEFCLRSVDNYASLVLADPRIGGGEDVSCQGAQVEDVLTPRETPDGELAAQIEAVTEDTDLVTLSIGGNDMGFGDIARCVNANMGGSSDSDCDGELGGLMEERLRQLPAQLDTVYREIHDRHGGDDLAVVATGYIPTVTGHDACAALDGLSTNDRFWVAALTFAINLSVRVAAENNGATYVNVDEHTNHTVCADPDQRFVDLTGEETDSYPLHPTPAGQEAMARAVLGAI